jgi:multiple sugar transport system substrate-binding protein
MTKLSRRSVLRGSLGLATAGAVARPYIANAAAETATMWQPQGFVPEEDAAFRAAVADYEKASGNKIDYSIIPFAPLRQKAVSAIASGVVPDVIAVADLAFAPLNAWDDKLIDLSDIVETQKSQFSATALRSCSHYNNVTKKRGYYLAPQAMGAAPFHIWRSLVEKAGYKTADIPNTWDAFLDFFEPVQTKLREQGMRNVYAHGYQLTTNGVDPIITFNAFLIAYGGKDLITPDGKLHTDDPHVREAAAKAIARLTAPFKGGFVPPGVVNWNDADDNNAFHAKLIVMDYDGSISTELALYHKKEEYDDILTRGLPLGNDGKELPSQILVFGTVIPKGAKNIEVAKEWVKYLIEPKKMNERLKSGLGRWIVPVPEIVKSDPFWLQSDPHVAAYVQQTVVSPTMPVYEAFTPAAAQVNAEHVFSVAMFDVMNNGMAPEQAIDKAFKRAEAIFEKYPIVES